MSRHSETRFMRVGPFAVKLETALHDVVEGVELLYPRAFFRDREPFTDFQISILRGSGLRGWIRPQAVFETDGERPFKPLPLAQALPMFEWGLNYCIANRAHIYLMIHAAAIERHGHVAILPGAPGAGKSTLAAALAFRGWRLLSDELTMIQMNDCNIVPLARPINLKNQSIAVIKRFEPGAMLSPEIVDTAKGVVALLRAPESSTARVAEVAPPRWIVFPHWQADAPARFEPLGKATSMIQIAQHSFNYHIHEERGFEVLADVVERCDCYRFEYGRLEDALDAFSTLAGAT